MGKKKRYGGTIEKRDLTEMMNDVMKIEKE